MKARGLLILAAVSFMAITLVLPLLVVFIEALSPGLEAYRAALADEEMMRALRLSLFITLLVVPVNALFGFAAAWAVTKHDFPGKGLLSTLIDLPFSVSPVVAGMLLVLLFGRRGLFGPWLEAHDVKLLFAVPGMAMATLFVTFPMVARELIPLMESQGKDEEVAARVMGAGGWRMIYRVTLPNVRLGLIYGLIVAAARSMGEFGAVSVVSGHIRGETNTLPLHIEALYNEYQLPAAFAGASLLALLGLVSLLLKTMIEVRAGRRVSRHARGGAR